MEIDSAPASPFSGRPLDQSLNWHYWFCLRILVDAICDLLHESREVNPVNQRVLAGRIGMARSRGYFSTILHEGLPSEKFIDLERELKALLKECQTRATIPSERLALAAKMLGDGLDQRVRLLMAFTGALGPTSVESPPPELDHYHKVLGSIANAYVVNPEADLSDDQVYVIVRQALPDLSRKELGVAYHLLGDAVLELSDYERGTNRYAARLFKRSVEHHGRALADSSLQLLRCLGRTAKRERPGGPELETLRKDALEVMTRCEVLAHQFPLPPYTLADAFKELADSFFTADSGNTAATTREFGRTLSFYDQAIEQHLDGAFPDRTSSDLAHLHLGRGFSLHRLNRHEEGVCAIEQALDLYSDLKQSDKIAYSFKLMALMYNGRTAGRRAVWCARAAVAVYGNPNTQANEADKKSAEMCLRDILAEPRNKPYANVIPGSSDSSLLAREYLAARTSKT